MVQAEGEHRGTTVCQTIIYVQLPVRLFDRSEGYESFQFERCTGPLLARCLNSLQNEHLKRLQAYRAPVAAAAAIAAAAIAAAVEAEAAVVVTAGNSS